MSESVSIAAIGLAATTVAGIIWVLKYLANTLSEDLRAHTKAAISQKQASDQVLEFMRNLNGKLAKITAKTMEEKGE